jgi:cobalt-zinc-cadmium efflux system membrane fusion protein
MKSRNNWWLVGVLLALASGCAAHGQSASSSGAPPPAVVDREGDDGTVRVDHPERFPTVVAGGRQTAPELTVTGGVFPDVSRTVPVVSLVSGRVVEIRARLGDHVTQGQVLLRIHSADVSSALADYKKAATDQTMTHAELEREKDLYEHNAIAKKDLEVAENADQKAAADLAASADRLRVLGADPNDKASGIVDVVAPASGVITEQNVTTAAGVKTLDNSPNLFTIADLSHVWIVCDVYENDLAVVHEGDHAEIHLSAYPDRVLTGRLSNIGAVLDPALHTAKVRVEVENPGMLRVGMFVTATFHGPATATVAVVPTAAILHLHDREWVYLPAANGGFRRQEVVSGTTLPGGQQEVRTGLRPGDRVIANALVLQNTVEQ